jgi:hypothetical protein
VTLAEDLAADRRLIILRALTEVPGASTNESVAQKAVAHFGHRVALDLVRADFQFLADLALVRIEKIQAQRGELWLAHLLQRGQDVANGFATVPGVAQRLPG